MIFDFPPFVIIYVFAAGISLVVAYLAWRRRSTPGGLPVAMLMLGVTEWALTAALEIGAVGETAKLFWSKIEYLGTVSSSVLFLVFALQYTHQEKWLTRRNVVLLWVIPLITLVMAATNEMHHWVWSRTEPSPAGNNLLIYYHGPWFWIYVAYAYACIVFGTLVMVWAIVRFPDAYRQQAGAMLAGALVPWLGNVIYLFGLNPIPGFDVTPVTFALTGLLISWGMFRYHLFDLVPVARDILIESLGEGVLVLDAQNRIADINPAARRLIGVSTAIIGQRAEIALAGFPELARLCCEPQETLAEISTGQENLRYLELRTSFLRGRRGQLTGRLIVLHDITERKDTENRLRQLSRAVEQSPVSIVITDTADCIEYVNPRFVEVTGYSFEEVQGKNPRLLKSGETPPEEYKRMWNTITSGGEWRGEFHNKKKNGELYWESATISPIMNEAGVITHFVAVKEDITERKRAEHELQAQRDFAQQVMNAMGQGLTVTNAEGRFEFVNPAYARLFGYTPQELMGKRPADLTPLEDRPVLDAARLQRRQGRSSTYETQLRRADGSIANVLITGVPRWQEGQVAGSIAVVTDLTERTQAEEALRASEERFRQLAENVHDVFWISTLDWSQMLYVSPAYEELWGCTCQSLYEQPMSFLDVVYPQDRPRILEGIGKLGTGEPAFSEFRVLRPDGSMGWMWSRIFPIRDESGEVYRVAGITEDVTELKRAEEEVRNALAKERELGELKSRFISVASHEFRTPLSSILGSAELLERYGHKWAEEKKLQHLHKIQTGVKNMTQLLEDVLIVGKAEAGKLEFNPVPLDLEQFCRGLVEEMQVQAGTHHTLTFNRRGHCADARMDEKLLRHILTNLLSNAIKYSPQGGTVQFDLDCQADQAIFRVQDQGIGIPPEAQQQVFDTFHRAGNVGKIPGTGLGMSIVKKSVDLHGGTISFNSQVGVGTTFTVGIPLHLPAQEANP